MIFVQHFTLNKANMLLEKFDDSDLTTCTQYWYDSAIDNKLHLRPTFRKSMFLFNPFCYLSLNYHLF